MGSTFHTIQVLFSQNRHGRVAISEDVARPVCKLCYAKPYRRLPGYATLRYASLRLTRRHRLLHHAKVDTSFCILPYRAKYCDRLVLQLSARSSVPRPPSCYLTRRHSGSYLQMVWVSRRRGARLPKCTALAGIYAWYDRQSKFRIRKELEAVHCCLVLYRRSSVVPM